MESPCGKNFAHKEVKCFMVHHHVFLMELQDFSGTELSLKGDLKTADNFILGDFLRILSRLSTISGGSGSR